MKITDIISITELARLLKKTRPTVYKYISDYEKGNYSALPHSVKKLFNNIVSGNSAKREIYEYCEHWYDDGFTAETFTTKRETKTTLNDVIKLLKNNAKKLDLNRIKSYIEEELK